MEDINKEELLSPTMSSSDIPKDFIHMDKEEFKKYTEKTNPKSNIFMDMLLAFLVGGVICCIGEALSMWFLSYGFDKEIVR